MEELTAVFTLMEVFTRYPTPVQGTLMRLLLLGRPVHVDVMVDAVYGHQADGGPEDAYGTLKQHLCALRRSLRGGFEVVNFPRGHGSYILRRKEGMATGRHRFRASLALIAEVEASTVDEAVASLERLLEEHGATLPDGQPLTIGMFALELGEAAVGLETRLWGPPAVEPATMTYIVASSYRKACICATDLGISRSDRWTHLTDPVALKGVSLGRMVVYGDATSMDGFGDTVRVAEEQGLPVEYH